MTHTAAYIAPCVFCINEKEHFTISDSDMNDLLIIYFTPTTVNGSLSFDNVGALADDLMLTLRQDADMLI